MKFLQGFFNFNLLANRGLQIIFYKDVVKIKEKNKINYLFRLLELVIMSLLLSLVLKKYGIEKESIIMVFLVGVLFVTIVTRGYIYGAVASVASVLLFNYLFTAPVHTFLIYNPNDISLLLFFFAASLISSSITSRSQKQLELAQKNEHTARLLYEVTESFANITGEENIVMQGIKYIYNNTGFNSEVVLYEPNKHYYNIEGAVSEDIEKSILEIEIQGLSKKLGKIKIFHLSKAFELEDELLIKMVAGQMGISLDREFIYNEREKIKVSMEKERLRANLLRGISHDLRTPLTAIVGASGVIIDNMDILDKESIKKLTKDINEESLWLNHLVENILNVTRISEESLVIQKNDEVVDDVINEALRHVSNLAGNRKMEVDIPEDVISVSMDGKLIVQVLINLLDNAIKHTKEDGIIKLRVYINDKFAVFEVEDNGEGIQKDIKDTLFERFVTAKEKVIDSKRGMGLGLSICRAFVKAHGGEISAANSVSGGAVFKFSLPLEGEE